MTIAINLSDSRGRDSQVLMESCNLRSNLQRVDARKQAVERFRGFKGSLGTDYATLTKDCEAAELPQQFIDGDPEIDFELFGKQIRETSRIYLKENSEPEMREANVNGLTFDFLYDMAKELEEQDSFLLLAAGEKSNQPLVLQRPGAGYCGLLEGRTDGDKYLLFLHLSNLELKSVVKLEAVA
jgi:hypothetical protein